MVVTGAGPGIMAAGIEGAGRANAFGVNIRLPFEQGANAFIAKDPKLVEMKYFFTRKLMLIKESDGYVCLPGGFGTLDEAFELLTLLQTGKAEPAPVVLLDMDGGTYWQAVGAVRRRPRRRRRVRHAGRRVLLAAHRLGRRGHRRRSSASTRNYHSLRCVGKDLVLRMQRLPTEAQLADLNHDFADMLQEGEHPHRRDQPLRGTDNDVRRPAASPSASTC